MNPCNLQAGHDFPTVFYLALGGSLLSYIYSAPPLKVSLLPLETNYLTFMLHTHTHKKKRLKPDLVQKFFAAETEWMDWKFCLGSKLYQFAMVWDPPFYWSCNFTLIGYIVFYHWWHLLHQLVHLFVFSLTQSRKLRVNVVSRDAIHMWWAGHLQLIMISRSFHIPKNDLGQFFSLEQYRNFVDDLKKRKQLGQVTKINWTVTILLKYSMSFDEVYLYASCTSRSYNSLVCNGQAPPGPVLWVITGNFGFNLWLTGGLVKLCLEPLHQT